MDLEKAKEIFTYEVLNEEIANLGLDLIAEVGRLRSALKRIYPIPSLILQRKPVRNLDEILLECEQALKEV